MNRLHALRLPLLLSAATLAACSTEPAADPAAAENIAIDDAMMANDGPMNDSPPMVGGAAMLPTSNIVENASKSADHTTLVAAVKAAGLAETLSGTGPFTVFAPTNAAFGKLPAGTVDGLLQPSAKADLTKILTYHVVPGTMTSAQLGEAIAAGNGRATLTTVEGGTLTAARSGDSIVLTDEKGGTSTVTIADVMQSNGVVHVVDSVVMPN